MPYDLNDDGKLDEGDFGLLSRNIGLGEACPVTKGDFNNDRCVDRNDKVALQAEIAKGEAQRNLRFDLDGNGAVNEQDLTSYRVEFRKGGKCDPLPFDIGDLDGNYCINEADVDQMSVLMRSASQIAIAQNDLNGDGKLDTDDKNLIRRSFGGDNCPDVVTKWGDFNDDGAIDMIIGSDVASTNGADGLLFASHINTKEGDANWDRRYDLNDDKAVNFNDFFILVDNFGTLEERTHFDSRSGSNVNLAKSMIRLVFTLKSGNFIDSELVGKYRDFNPIRRDVRGKIGLNFVTLESASDLTGKIEKISISVNYNDTDVTRLGIAEETLKLYYYNPSTDNWELIDTTVDTSSNLVTGETNHLSEYGLFGDTIVFGTTGEDSGSVANVNDAGSSSRSSGGRSGGSGNAGCPTVFIQNAEGICKYACQSSIAIWQNQGYNVVDQCSVGEPQPPVSPSFGGEDYPTIDDYEDAGISRSDADSDNDGILDDLELQFFGDLTQGFDDDYDEDGIVNGKEINVDQTNPTDPSDFLIGDKGVNTGIIVGVVLVIILGAGIGTVVWMRKQRKSGSSSSSSTQPIKVPLNAQEKKIVAYIKEARAAGMNDSEIKSNLIKAGWKGSQVENAFSSLR